MTRTLLFLLTISLLLIPSMATETQFTYAMNDSRTVTEYDFGGSYNTILTGYTMKAYSTMDAVQAWDLYASNDGNGWSLIDSRSSQAFTSGTNNTYSVAGGLIYRYYLLHIKSGFYSYGTNLTLTWIYTQTPSSPLSPSDAQTWCGIQTLYFQHNLSTSPPGYEELINYPSGNTEVDESITINSAMGPVLLDSYITPEGAFQDTSELLKGLRRYRMFHYVSSASGTTVANYSVYIRDQTGKETFVYSALSDDINDLVVNEYLTSYVKQEDSFLSPTDRIVIKIYGQTTHPSNIVFHFVYQGSTHTSHVESGYFVCEGTVPESVSVYRPSVFAPVGNGVAILAVAAMAIIAAIGKRRKN